MKTFKILIIAMLVLSTSCGKAQKKVELFGERIIVDYPQRVDTLEGYIVELEGAYTGLLFAYDGLLVFKSELHRDGWLYLFDAETGKRISAIAPRGNGPNEFVNLLFWRGFEKNTNTNEIYLWVNDFHRQNLVLLNTQGERVREVSTSEFRQTSNPFGIGGFHMLNDSLLLAHVHPWRISETRFTASGQHVFNFQQGKTVREFMIFSEYDHPADVNWPSQYLTSNTALKPDRTKLAIAMFDLRRLNILDLESGEVKSIATTGSPHLHHLWHGERVVEHYRGIKSDDYFIFVIESMRARRTEANARFWSEYLSTPSGRIFVFDWEGNFLRILQVNEDAAWITFDPVRRILYSRTDCERITAYDVNFLYE